MLDVNLISVITILLGCILLLNLVELVNHKKYPRAIQIFSIVLSFILLILVHNN